MPEWLTINEHLQLLPVQPLMLDGHMLDGHMLVTCWYQHLLHTSPLAAGYSPVPPAAASGPGSSEGVPLPL
jgi:hypothetical protein